MTLTQITEKGIKDGEIINADINASAAIAGTKISPDFGSQNITTTGRANIAHDLTITGTAPRVILTDTDHNSDFRVNVDSGLFSVQDTSNSNVSRLEIGSDGKFRVGCTAQPSSSVGGFQLDMGSYPGTARISSGAGASGTDSASIQIAGSNHNASLAHGANSGAALNLINYNTTDGNSTSISFHNSNSLASSRILGHNESHSSRTGNLVFMTANGSHPVETMRLTHDGRLGIGTTPVAPFHVKHATTNAVAEFESGDTNVSIKFKDNSTSTAPAIGATGDNLTLSAGSLERIHINGSNGRVGIGQAATGSPLHVYHATTNESIRCKSGDEYVHIGFEDSTTTNVPYMGAQGNHLRFITGGSERLRVQSGGGISFNADTAAANALDDYEEGTFTPSWEGETSAGTTSYGNGGNHGNYTKIGNTVHIRVYSEISGATGSGAWRMSLPFSSANDLAGITTGSCMLNNFNFDNNYTWVVPYKNSGTSYLYLYTSGDSVGWDAPTVSEDSSFSIILGITYRAA